MSGFHCPAQHQRRLEDNSRTQRVVTWVQSRFSGMTVEERQDTLARNILEQAPQSYVDSVASLRESDTGGMDLPGPLSFSVFGMVGSGNELFTQGVSAIGLISFRFYGHAVGRCRAPYLPLGGG